MKELHLERKKVDIKEFKDRTALLSDVSKVIKEDIIVYVDRQPILLYKVLDKDLTKHLRWAVKRIPYEKDIRTRGLKTQSKIFGYFPRVPLRNDFCHSTDLSVKHPKEHFIIVNFATELHKIYQEYFPTTYEKHMEMVNGKVLDEWKIGATPFTSGIVNKNNPLKYHFDAGNFKGVLSNMIALKKGVEGGYLVFPEFDFALEIADNSLSIFDGQDIIHGVSPFELTQPDGYRYTAVYYSLEQMWQCLPIDEEIVRIRELVKEKAEKRNDPEHLAKLEKMLTTMKNKNK
jgi:hypothetical protein